MNPSVEKKKPENHQLRAMDFDEGLLTEKMSEF